MQACASAVLALKRGEADLRNVPHGRPSTDDQIAVLKDLVGRKVSLTYASVILMRPTASARIKAGKFEMLFPGARAT